MRKLVESSIVSLDGVVGAPWEWTGPLFDAEVKDYSRRQLARYDAFLLGRWTYEKLGGSWSQIRGEAYFDTINAMPKYVASTTLDQLSWHATRLDGDLVEAVAELKARPGRDLVKYGPGLDRTLVAHGLVDEFHFLLMPVVVGAGPHLLEGVDTGGRGLELVDTTRFGNGVLALTYVPK